MKTEIAVISIHPRWVTEIESGRKTVEFRRRWTQRNVSKIIIYATAPISKIWGVVSVKEVIYGPRSVLWDINSKYGVPGATKRGFYGYFHGLKKGYAILIGRPKLFKTHAAMRLIFRANFTPPQGIRFLTDAETDRFNKIFKRK
jgi:predicted transcriptional regulator